MTQCVKKFTLEFFGVFDTGRGPGDSTAMTHVLVGLQDLMFRSRITEAAGALGVEVRFARSPEELWKAASEDPPSRVILDLDNPMIRGVEAIGLLRADPSTAGLPIVGYLSHVNREVGEEALAAGCTETLPRSQFVQRLPELLS